MVPHPPRGLQTLLILLPPHHPVPSDPTLLLPSFIRDRLHALTGPVPSSSSALDSLPLPSPHHTHLKSPFLPPTSSYLHYASGLPPFIPPSSLHVFVNSPYLPFLPNSQVSPASSPPSSPCISTLPHFLPLFLPPSSFLSSLL